VAGFSLIPQPAETLKASGTIEARTIRVGSKAGGRIQSVLVHEGDKVTTGQTLVVLDSAELDAELEQAAARVERARASLQKLLNGYQPEEVEEARAAAEQARAALEEAESGYREEEIAQAAAERDRVQAEAQNAQITFNRYENLLREEAISRQQRDDAKSRLDQARAAVEKASQRLTQLQSGERPEIITAAEQRLRQAKAAAQRIQRGYRTEEIAAARAELAAAQAERRGMEARQREARVAAPADAVVEVLDVRPGDLINPNAPIATLLERAQLYVRVYVPETKLGMVHPGQAAEIFVDSFANHAFTARVEQVSQKGEFLPRNVQSEEARAYQFFGVKLALHDPESRLRPGMTANAQLHLKEN
jgi:multidrug resistance efflux pump